MLRFLSKLALIAVSIAYPVLVWWLSMRTDSGAAPSIIGGFLGATCLVRAVVVYANADLSQTDKARSFALCLAGLTFALVLMFSRSQTLALFYPPLVSLAVSFVFFQSLSDERSLIERFAQMSGAKITVRAKRYTRKLTFIWGVLLVVNAAIASVLALYAPVKWWVVWTGFASYLVFILFFLAEYAYRGYSIAKFGP